MLTAAKLQKIFYINKQNNKKMKKVYLILVSFRGKIQFSTYLSKVFASESDAKAYASYCNRRSKNHAVKCFTVVRVDMYVDSEYVKELYSDNY